MASSDTVVGIVGAVLLAGIMVSVFVYEYNNVPATTPPPGNDKQTQIAAFHAAHKHLNATEDLDGDGKANWNDTDLDGNGVLDANQTGDFVFFKPFHSTISAATPPAPATTKDHPFSVATGGLTVTVRLNYNVTVPLPGAPRTPTLSLSLGTPSGEILRATSGDATQNGAAVTIVFTLSKDLPAGNYTLHVTEDVAGPPDTPYQASAAIDYGPAHVAPIDSSAK